MPDPLDDAAADLLMAITEAVYAGLVPWLAASWEQPAPDFAAILTSGLPPGIAQAAARFASRRSNAIRGAGPRATPLLARYGQLVAEFKSVTGHPPSVAELASLIGRGNTAARDARRRLQALNMWPA